MASTNSSANLTTVFNENPSTKLSLESCGYLRTSFETVDSSVPYIVNAALNVQLSIIATVLNIFSFLAIRQIHHLRLPSKLLLCSLILTDLGVGVITQPLFVALLISKFTSSYSVQCFLLTTFVTASNVVACASVLSMTAISMDRYIALYFHIRYREIVSTKRICVLLAVIWSLGPVIAFTGLCNRTLHIALPIAIFSTCFLVISFAYLKIYRGLREQARQRVTAERQNGRTLNVARYRRLTSGMLWIKILFVLCYLPYGCIRLVIQFTGYTAVTQCILEFSATCIHLNSFLNPYAYCLHLPEVRRNFLRRLRSICG